MQRPNPMAGPAYVVALQNALEKKVTEYHTPPRTGGTQISTRFDEFVLNHVDAIVDECDWNRAEVLYALVQRGLFDLYAFLDPAITERIVEKTVAKLAPPQPPPTRAEVGRMAGCASAPSSESNRKFRRAGRS
jgi:hypothetical protein